LVHEPAVVRRICLYVDRFNPPYAGVTGNLLTLCEKHSIKVTAAPPSAEQLSPFGVEEGTNCDIAVVVGGDGTILRGLDFFRDLRIPVLGVNAGHLGFLAGVELSCMDETIERIRNGDYLIETLPVLKAEFPSGSVLTAVNDFSLNRSMMGGILHFGIYVNDILVANVAGDGVVISTPLGSTAYGLSCGGPILTPGLNAMLVVAICPHSLSLRPLVVPGDHSIMVKVGELRGTGPVVSADGSPSGTLKEGETLRLTAGRDSCMTVRFADEPDYYSKLGKKLGWGIRGSNA